MSCNRQGICYHCPEKPVSHTRFLRITVALVGGTVAAVGLYVLLVAGESEMSVARVGPLWLGWLLPLIAGSMVGLAAWLLLSDVGTTPTPRKSAAKCASCDAQVFENWRLCPYCGSFVDESAEVAESVSIRA